MNNEKRNKDIKANITMEADTPQDVKDALGKMIQLAHDNLAYDGLQDVYDAMEWVELWAGRSLGNEYWEKKNVYLSQLRERKIYTQWISVKDRLPDKNEKVIWLYKDGSMWIGTGGPDISSPFTLVAHWMPLPEKPKQAEQNDKA